MKARMPKQPGVGNMQQMVKQAQVLQEKMEQAQEQLNDKEFEAVAGGNAVKVTFNGKKEMVSIHIQEEVIDPEDKEMLEDLVMAAVNSCLSEIEQISEEEMSKINSGFGIPGMM